MRMWDNFIIYKYVASLPSTTDPHSHVWAVRYPPGSSLWVVWWLLASTQSTCWTNQL